MSAIVERLEPEIRQALDSEQLENLRELLADQHAPDLADVLERLDPEQQLEVFQILPIELQAEVIDQLGGRATQELVARLPVEHIGDLLDELPMDDAVEILTEDVPELQEQSLAAMEEDDAAEVKRLLQYPPHSAGQIMTESYVQIRPNMTVAEVLQHLRQIDEEVETINDLYVVNGQNRLMGVLSLRELLRHQPHVRVEEFMETDVISVTPEMDQEPVARLVARYHFLAVPVVDEDKHMLGFITVDDVIDVLTEENTEDFLRFGGVEGGATIDQPYFTIPLIKVL